MYKGDMLGKLWCVHLLHFKIFITSLPFCHFLANAILTSPMVVTYSSVINSCFHPSPLVQPNMATGIPSLAQPHTNQPRVDPGFAAAVNAVALQQKMEAVTAHHKPTVGEHFNLDSTSNPAIAQRIGKRV